MREDLKSWCQENMLQVKESKTPGVVECDGKTFLLLEEKGGYVCDEDFELILSDEEKVKSKQVDNFLYKWGTKFYYTPVENAKILQDDNLRPFEYIGKANVTTPGFPMLGIHGFYEILNGSRKYSAWVDKAKFFEIDTLGICEKNTLAGTLSFQDACVAANIKSVLGETITISTPDDIFLEGKVFALNEGGWRNLLLINSELNVINESQIIKQDRLLELGKGVCFIFDPLLFPYDKLTINKYLKAFDKCFYKIDTVEYDSDVTDQKFLEETQKYLNSDLEPIVLCDAYYLDKDDYRVKAKLNAIGGSKERGSINQYFKCDDENMGMFSALFEDADYENVLERAYANLDKLCQGIDFKIQTGKFKLPEYRMTEEESSQYATNEDLFNALILEGFDKKGLGDLPNADEYIDRIEKEVDVILYGGFVDYFLTLHDIVQWCHKNNILVGFGRGSAAGALISYLLGIVNVDPLKYGLLFERFLTKERARKSLPDIDTDFEAARRDDVKKYMEERYGEDKVCSIGTYSALQLKAVFGDFAKLDNTPVNKVKYLSAIIDDNKDNQSMKASRAPWEYIFKLATRNSVLFDFVQEHADMIEEMRLCYEQPRSAGVHACATVILPQKESLYTSIPVRKGIVNGKSILISEWEGSQIEEAGYLKEDILGIKQLDKFRMILDLIEQYYGKRVDIYNLPLEESGVYDMFCEGRNGDVFHLGSKGLTQYCMQMHPRSIEELTVALALYRPGPMDNNFHNEYILRKFGQKKIEFQPGLEKITVKTQGLLVYQEQIMQACTHMAGFSLSEADDVRKGIAKSKKKYLAEQGDKFINGAIKNGYDKQYVEELWHSMVMFGRYSFNLSHALCYAITGYVCQYLKWKYPLPYWITALEFSQANGDDMLRYISEIGSEGRITMAPPDINKSKEEFYADFTDKKIFWSIPKVKQCGEVATKFIFEERELNGTFFSFNEFLSRIDKSKVNKSVVENLILAGAFDDIEDIKNPSHRANLVRKYREVMKVKIPKGRRDWFTDAETSGRVNEEWWWLLQQKKVCGLAFFDYANILYSAGEDAALYMRGEDFAKDDVSRLGMVHVAGIVDTIELKSNSKGEYCKIRIEDNYTFMWLTIWGDAYPKIKNSLEGKEGSIVYVKARAFFDGYRNENALQSDRGFSIKFLE